MIKSTLIEEIVIKTLEENKAINVVIIDLSGKSDIANTVIVASGTSSRHILTLKDKISRNLSINKFKILASEGEDTANWIVIDLDSVIVHLFREEVRNYYKIEDIWKVE